MHNIDNVSLRQLNPSDLAELKRIHGKFYSKEFSFHDLFDNSLSSLVVTDNNDKIIVGGQVRVIAEATIVTDKDVNIELRRKALNRLLNAFKFSIASKGFYQLHAFVQDEVWERHLKRHGFKDTVGKSLVINVEEG